MARRRVDANRLRELVRLRRMGVSSRRVARMLRIGPNQERRYRMLLDEAGLLTGPTEELPTVEVLSATVRRAMPSTTPPQERSSVEFWRSKIEALWLRGLTAQAVFDRLRIETPPDGSAAFSGSYPAVRRLVRQLERRRGAQAADVDVPVDTGPGEVAEVDFGYAGRLVDPETGTLRRAWVFVLVLRYSKLLFVRLAFDQKVETWIDLHVRAFAALGGVPATIRPDNAKSAVTRAAFAVDETCDLNRSYRELAAHYGCKVDPTPPGQPWKKGAAEAAVRYVRSNALKGREGERLDHVQAALDRWNRDVASTRIHGTTKRRPRDVFDSEECGALLPLPAPYDPVVWRHAKVHPDCHVELRGRLFSVPWTLVHREVWVRATSRAVLVYHDDQVVASHPRTDRRRTTDETHLPPGRRDLRQRGREVWEERAVRIGPETLAFVRNVFDADPILSQLRRVQAIVTHLERHPRARAEATCRLARLVGDYSYHWVKHVLANALDLSPRRSHPSSPDVLVTYPQTL